MDEKTKTLQVSLGVVVVVRARPIRTALPHREAALEVIDGLPLYELCQRLAGQGIEWSRYGEEIAFAVVDELQPDGSWDEDHTRWFFGDRLTERLAEQVLQQLVRPATCALADLEGILPEFEPSGDRAHPAWTTIEELRAALQAARPWRD